MEAGNAPWSVEKKKNYCTVRYYFLFEWLRAFLVGGVYTYQPTRIRSRNL